MCPTCNSDTSVKDSRLQPNGTIKRRRVCEGGHKFSTLEIIAAEKSARNAARRLKEAA